jgi:dihydropteroate synthase
VFTWQTSRRKIEITRPLVMGILNVTPDSFSDGGRYSDVDLALERAEAMIAEGADILDIGGESTRPGSTRVEAEIEINRTLPVVSAIAKRFDTPISIDTSKSAVARALIDHGAEIINDISGLRWDARIAEFAAESGTGLVLMHSRGSFETMHTEPPVENAIEDVLRGLKKSLDVAHKYGVGNEQIVLDIGIGFGKTLDQNLELIAKLDRIDAEFTEFPLLVGASRKSFIGKLLGGVSPEERVYGSVAVAVAAVMKGAMILRVHDVKATVDAVKVAQGIVI